MTEPESTAADLPAAAGGRSATGGRTAAGTEAAGAPRATSTARGSAVSRAAATIVERATSDRAEVAGPGDVVDIWVNFVSDELAAKFLSHRQNRGIDLYLKSSEHRGEAASVLAVMDELGVTTGIVTADLGRGAEEALAAASEHPGRFLVAGGVTDPSRPTRNVRRVRALAEDPAFVMVRVMSVATGAAVNDPRHYPLYSVCEELSIPVGINVGVPGPKVRSRLQHPEMLEDVLIDFPDLVVVGAHMGHPYEELLMNYMRKWRNLYLSCTAYSPRYMDHMLLRFMNSSTYRGRVLWGSDEPWFPMRRSLTEARDLPLDPTAMELFLGGTARKLFTRNPTPGAPAA
ncbi:MAG: amidohydrolase family protein [Actinomycetota bacterium]|nr:amidohydrolase family protein [Actinomycetota bacterium]